MNAVPPGYGHGAGPQPPWQPLPPPRKGMNVVTVVLLILVGIVVAYVGFFYLLAKVDDAAHDSQPSPSTSTGSHGGV